MDEAWRHSALPPATIPFQIPRLLLLKRHLMTIQGIANSTLKANKSNLHYAKPKCSYLFADDGTLKYITCICWSISFIFICNVQKPPSTCLTKVRQQSWWPRTRRPRKATLGIWLHLNTEDYAIKVRVILVVHIRYDLGQAREHLSRHCWFGSDSTSAFWSRAPESDNLDGCKTTNKIHRTPRTNSSHTIQDKMNKRRRAPGVWCGPMRFMRVSFWKETENPARTNRIETKTGKKRSI